MDVGRASSRISNDFEAVVEETEKKDNSTYNFIDGYTVGNLQVFNPIRPGGGGGAESARADFNL